MSAPTLVEFLTARLDEDEAVAREATNDGHRWLVEEETISLWPDDLEPAPGNITFPRKAHAYHAATWNPDRVLAEVEAKRRIVAASSDPDDGGDGGYPDGWWSAWEYACRTLATVYEDHPDYRDEWRP